VVIAADGQMSLGNTVLKAGTKKLRKLSDGKVIAGFAGSTADGLTLLDRLESHLKDTSGNLLKAAVNLARDWRTDRYLRRLEAMMIVADKDLTLLLSGSGDVVEPDDGIAGIGSGGPYALAAARALSRHSALDAEAIAREAVSIASEICIYTNERVSLLAIDGAAPPRASEPNNPTTKP